jgi:hypothetical protein
MWSPDGTMLSYASELSGLGGLRVVSVDSGKRRAPYDEPAVLHSLRSTEQHLGDGRLALSREQFVPRFVPQPAIAACAAASRAIGTRNGEQLT